MNYRAVRFSGHAIRQMFERKLKIEDVIAILKNGEIIREYPEDTPYPSYLCWEPAGEMPCMSS